MATLKIKAFSSNGRRVDVESADVVLPCGTELPVSVHGKIDLSPFTGETMPSDYSIYMLESLVRHARLGANILQGNTKLNLENPKKKRRKK
jgi:hypothetical protein